MVPGDFRKGLFVASHALYPLDDPDANADIFLQRWGAYTPHNLRRVLQAEEASKHDKILLLYALGYLVETEATALLLSSLQSKERSERWVSALSLGRQKQEVVFALLQNMLLEELLDFDVELRRDDIQLDAKDWYYDKDWYITLCRDIVFVLGDWGSAAAAPSLRKAFMLCLEHEMQCDTALPAGLSPLSLWWRPLENGLAYALGQVGAWGAFSATQFSFSQWNRASLYLILGSLHSSPDNELDDYRWNWTSEQIIVKRRSDGILTASFIGLDQIRRVLQERFGFSPEEQTSYFQQIWEADPKYEFLRPSQRK